jgi:hypothetical protein
MTCNRISTANGHLALEAGVLQQRVMRARTACHFTFKSLLCVQIYSLRLSVHSVQPPSPIGKQESEPTFCIGWEQHCSVPSSEPSLLSTALQDDHSAKNRNGWRTLEREISRLSISTPQGTESASFDQMDLHAVSICPRRQAQRRIALVSQEHLRWRGSSSRGGGENQYIGRR